MQDFRARMPGVLIWTVLLPYFSLTIWMHIWALEVGLPTPDRPAEPHHQVCTWIGTSGEAGVAEGLQVIRPVAILSFCPARPGSSPVLPIVAWAIQPRAPPVA